MDILSLYLYQPAFKVNEKIAYFIFKTLGAGRSLAVAQRGADAGQQLSRAKGFGEVVVSSQVQGSHLAALQGLAEITMMGRALVDLTSCMSSRPSMSGSPRSRSTTSGLRDSMSFSPSVPVLAQVTW